MITVSKAMQDLFKPYELDFIGVEDLLEITGLSKEELLKLDVQDECSKSIDGSCINTDCTYNYVEIHGDELYVKVYNQIQAERKAVEDKLKKDMEKYNGKS